MEESRHWLYSALVPCLALVEPDDAERISQSCQRLDPSCGGSLLRLLDAKRGSRRAIEYLTPALRLSQVFRFRVVPATDLTAGKSAGRSLDNALYQVVASSKPEPGRIEVPFPWFSKFRQTLFQATLFWEELAQESGSQLHMPVAAFFAVHALEKDPGVMLQHMHDRCVLPAGVPRIMLIIQDAEVSDEACEVSERLVKGEFGAENVCVLRLHSEKAFEESYHETLYRVVMLTQKRLFALHEAVGSQRKGLSGTFRSLFSTGYAGSGSAAQGRSAAGSTKERKAYGPETHAYKVRCLADLLFWMRDFDTALQNYAALRDDYAKDESFLHLGHANEMIAICSFLSRGAPSTYEEGAKRVELVDRAVDGYIRAVPMVFKPDSTSKQTALGHRLATRASLLLLDIAPRNGFSSMKVMMKPLSQEDELCAAILLEQIALLMVDQGVAQRGMRRKSGFNGLLAGSLFRSLGLDKHAWRCYLSVYQNTRGRGWGAAEHHLEVNLGNLSRNLGDMASFISFRGRCLERGFEVTNSNQHKNFLNEVCEAITAEQQPIALAFVLPGVVAFQRPLAACDESVRFADASMKTQWERIERHLENLVKFRRRPQGKVFVHAQEPFYVEVTFRNPLNCPLTIYNAGITLGDDSTGLAEVRCSPTLTLKARERRSLDLVVVPLQENRPLLLTGVKWKLVNDRDSFVSYSLPTGALSLNVLAPAPSLVPLIDYTNRSPEDPKIRVALRNDGASILRQGSRVLFGCECLAGVEWMLPDGSGSEVVDSQGLVQQIAVPHDVLPGQLLELVAVLSKPQPGPALPVVILSGESRMTRFALPQFNVPRAEAKVSATAKTVRTAAGELLLTVELESSSLSIRPVGISCFSPTYQLAPLARETDAIQSPAAKRWSLVTRFGPASGSSFVSLDRSLSQSAFPPLGPDDFALRAHHAHQVHLERMEAQRRFEQEKAELEARGQLPVSIQDVRRARQRGELSAKLDSNDNAGPPGSASAILARPDLLQISVEYTEDSSANVHRTFAVRVPVKVPLLLVTISRALPRLIRLKPSDELLIVPVEVRVSNSGLEQLENIRLTMSSQATSGDHFPAPQQWLGPLHTTFALAPGKERSITLSAVLTSAGLYAIGPAKIEYTSANGIISHELSEILHVTVVRGLGDTEQIYGEVEAELS